MFKRVVYVWNEQLLYQCDRLPSVPGRATMVHNLILNYGLSNSRSKLLRPATFTEMRRFHSQSYLEYLKQHTTVPDNYTLTAEDELYGTTYDCPPVSDMYGMSAIIAGASIFAGQLIVDDKADVAVNWCGGWHHARSAAARGYCYVNDVVLLIDKLKEKFSKILYINLDIHHDDAIQEAYYKDTCVFTLSFHKYEPGFYPGSGNIYEIGSDAGLGYNCNFPFYDGYSDQSMSHIFERVFNNVCSKYKPTVIVLQCGGYALAGDPYGGADLTSVTYLNALELILARITPLVLLGGGGYNHYNVAQLWTALLARARRVTIIDNNADKAQSTLIPAVKRSDFDPNNIEYLNLCMDIVDSNLKVIGTPRRIVDAEAHSSLQQAAKDPKPEQTNRIFVYRQTKRNRQPDPKPLNLDVYDFNE